MSLTSEDVQTCKSARVVWQGELREIFETYHVFPTQVSKEYLEYYAPRNPFTGRRHQYPLCSKTTTDLLRLFSLWEGYRKQVENSGEIQQDPYYNWVNKYQDFAWEILFFRAFMTPGEFEGIQHLQRLANYSLCQTAYEIILDKLYREYSIPMIWVLEAFAEGERIADQTLREIGMLPFRTEANHRNLIRKYCSLPMGLRQILSDFHLHDLFWNVESFREVGNDYGRVFQSLNQRIDELNRMRGEQELEEVPLETQEYNADGNEIGHSFIDDEAFKRWQTTDSEVDRLLEELDMERLFSQFRSFIETRTSISERKKGYFLRLLDALEANRWQDSAQLQMELNVSEQKIVQLKKEFLRALKEFVQSDRGGISNEN